MGVGSLSLITSIDFLLPFHFLDNLVQLIEACVPELAIPLDPGSLFLESARAEFAGPHAPDLLRAGECHVEPLGKVRDRSVGTSELLQNAASGGIRKRGERVIEAGLRILN